MLNETGNLVLLKNFIVEYYPKEQINHVILYFTSRKLARS